MSVDNCTWLNVACDVQLSFLLSRSKVIEIECSVKRRVIPGHPVAAKVLTDFDGN
jgi:hypothetical protein